MSMFVEHQGRFLSMNTYVLTEALKPSKIDYGTNPFMDDGKIDVYKGGQLFTFFKKDGKYYAVSVNKMTFEVGFAVSDRPHLNPGEYLDDRTTTRSALKVFNHAMFVVMEVIQRAKMDQIKFSAANPSLGKVYDKAVKNKFLLGALKEKGFVYKGLDSKDNHVFEKMPG